MMGIFWIFFSLGFSLFDLLGMGGGEGLVIFLGGQ
jgi:hypothetical protein